MLKSIILNNNIIIHAHSVSKLYNNSYLHVVNKLHMHCIPEMAVMC